MSEYSVVECCTWTLSCNLDNKKSGNSYLKEFPLFIFYRIVVNLNYFFFFLFDKLLASLLSLFDFYLYCCYPDLFLFLFICNDLSWFLIIVSFLLVFFVRFNDWFHFFFNFTVIEDIT